MQHALSLFVFRPAHLRFINVPLFERQNEWGRIRSLVQHRTNHGVLLVSRKLDQGSSKVFSKLLQIQFLINPRRWIDPLLRH